MEDTRSRPWRSRRRPAGRGVVGLVAALAVSGCSVVATPGSAPVPAVPPPPQAALGYVVCPTALSPVELATRTAEDPIPLPVQGTPALGDFAVATSPDGRSAFVVTTTGSPGAPPRPVLVPVDLVTQRAGRPIALPGRGGTRAVVVTHDGTTVLAAVGTTVVPVDVATRAVGTPLDLGPGRDVSGLALSPTTSTLYVLVPDGVVPVDTTTARAGAPVVTGLGVSSVASPHGLAVSPDGHTVYVVGQGGSDFGGRLVAMSTATGTVGPATSFDQFGITDPSAVAVTGDGSQVLVADSANNWIVPVPAARLGTPDGPVLLPSGDAAAAGTDHPSDVVVGPGTTGAFVVTGLDTVLPYSPASGSFGRPIPVCAGASSMAVSG